MAKQQSISSTVSDPPKRKGFSRHQWLVLATLMIASFLGRLDGTIVNLALPKMMQDFGINVTQASWISTAYIIANAIFVPVFGKLGDLIGRKPLYIFGILGFTVTSMMAGLSFNLSSMIVFRVLQAITVSIDYPIALSIIAYNFQDKKERAQAMGMWSAIFAAAIVFGPLIGGPLTDNFSWRSVFYINVPLGIIGTIMALRFIEEPVKEIKGIKNFDILGSVLLGIMLGTLCLVLDQGQSWGWSSTNSIMSYIITVVSFVSFLVVELRAKEPVVDLKFFRIPTFSASILTSFLSFMGMMGGIFLIPLFAQTYLGYSVTKTGLLFIPLAFGMMISAQVGARLAFKLPARLVIGGGMLWAATVFYSFSALDIKWGVWDIGVRLFLMALGLGLGLAPLTQSATSTVPLHEVGIASSILALARNIAGAFGTAIFATVLSNSVTASLIAIERYSTINTTSPALLQQIAMLMPIKANIAAYGTVFKSATIFMVIGAIAALFVKDLKGQSTHHEPMEL